LLSDVTFKYNSLLVNIQTGENLKQHIPSLTGRLEEKEVATKYNKLRSHLQNEQKRLVGELEQLKADIRPAEVRREGSPFGKREEEASESFELEKRLALEKQIRDHLSGVEQALRKFEEGTYGLCDSCGQPIASDRLEALPQASLCMNCKAKNAKVRFPPG